MSEVLSLLVLLVIAPLLPAVSTKTVAVLTGRRGAPVFQLYRDLGRLLQKGLVYSTATTWLFRVAPVMWVLCAVGAACLVPLNGRSGLAHFPGDFLFLTGFLAVGRYFLTLAALDTGSSFEGMGVSRELMIGSFAEPALFLAFLTLALATGGLSLSELFGTQLAQAWTHVGASVAMVGISLALLLLAEAARGPIDDPATHLELTMIHEVMVLDHSGPDLALLFWGSSLRFAVFAALIVSIVRPWEGASGIVAVLAFPMGLVLVAVLVGVVEASIARLRMVRIPQYIFSAGVLAALGALLMIR
jgi:formate hydrogenlyase subunit 4